VTVSIVTNLLTGSLMRGLEAEVGRAIDGTFKKGGIPPAWDGRVVDRIADDIGRSP